MKKYVLVTGVVTSDGLGCPIFWGEVHDLVCSRKKWEIQTLNANQFKSGDLVKCTPMAVDIVKRSLYVGESRKTVREELGDPDSYFFSDIWYAYKIMPFPGEGEENWHLVFIPDEKLKKEKMLRSTRNVVRSRPWV